MDGGCMSDPLIMYLAEHLAGSVHAIELLKHMRKAHREDALAEFAQEMLAEIEMDRKVLEQLAKHHVCSDIPREA